MTTTMKRRTTRRAELRPTLALLSLLLCCLTIVAFAGAARSAEAEDDDVDAASRDAASPGRHQQTNVVEEDDEDDEDDDDDDEDGDSVDPAQDETDPDSSSSASKIEWVETYDGALYEARFAEPAGGRWVVLVLYDDSRWSSELLQRVDHSAEAARLAREHFVMAKVLEEDLPTYARYRFNALAPYAPSVFFIEPDGQVRPDIINEFAPEDQDPVYKYFYQTATPLARMMALVAEKHIPATMQAASQPTEETEGFHEEL